MWRKISDKTKISKGDKILRYPTDGINNTDQPTGQEENCYIYEVTSSLVDEFSIKWIVKGTIDKMTLGNMIRQVNSCDLKNGEWWYDGDE